MLIAGLERQTPHREHSNRLKQTNPNEQSPNETRRLRTKADIDRMSASSGIARVLLDALDVPR
jgi:hypothetical protein